MQSWAPPYGVFCLAQVFNGAGLGLQDAQVRSSWPLVVVVLSLLLNKPADPLLAFRRPTTPLSLPPFPFEPTTDRPTRQANTFVAHLPNMMNKMSILHAVYGVGALVCPLVATQFATLEHWSYQYLTSLGLALFVRLPSSSLSARGRDRKTLDA